MASILEIISKEFIKPSSPTPQNLKNHRLSFLDQIHTRSYVPRIFFYKAPSCSPNIDRFQISHQLKRSLSDVLTKYYPLAGRINEDGLLVDCNDSGALFVEAQVHALLSQTIESSATLEELEQYLPIKPFANCDDPKRDIVLAVQINFFECGGIGIGVCISHKVADLMSLVTFVNAWAATCRGERKLIPQPNFHLGSHHFPPRHIPRAPSSKIENLMLVKEKVGTKRFLFDKKKLVELKALASSTEVPDPTRVEVVSAFIYKQLMEIKYHAKVNPKKVFAFSHSVNLRTRMRQQDELPLDEFAFGNLAPSSMSAVFMYEEVEKFHDLVSAMRTVIRKFKDAADAIEMSRQLAIIGNTDIHHCHFTSGCRFPLSEVDYGWGKPLSVCTRALPVKNAIILMDAKCGDGIQALVTLADEDMEMLPNELLSLENNDFSN